MSTRKPNRACITDNKRKAPPLSDEQRNLIGAILRASPTYPYRVTEPSKK